MRPSYGGKSEDDVKFLRIVSQKFRVIQRNDRFLLAAQCATGACEDDLSSCKKWIQVDCQAACWTETLLDIARIKDIRRAAFNEQRKSLVFITFIDSIFKHIVIHDDGLKQFTKFLYGEVPFNAQEEDVFKKHIEALTSKCLMGLSDETVLQQQQIFFRWRESFSQVALSYLQNQGHILFCYRISRESTFCYKRVIPRCFEKAFFMYYLIENKDALNNFLRKYLDDVSSRRDAYFGFNMFCLPQERCRMFLPEGITKFQEICICQLMSISSALCNGYFGLCSLPKAENRRYLISLIDNPRKLTARYFYNCSNIARCRFILIKELLKKNRLSIL